MPVSHHYETVVVDQDFARLSLRIVSFPLSEEQRNLPARLLNSTGIFDELGALGIRLTQEPNAISRVEELVPTLSTAATWRRGKGAPDLIDNADLRAFAEEVLAVRLPVEFSPMEPSDFASVLEKTGKLGGPALLAFATFGPTPLVILITAGSIILFGAADGIAEGLRKGLAERIHRWSSGRRR